MIADDQNSNGSSTILKFPKSGDIFGIRALLHRNGKAEGEAVGVDRFGDYLRMNLDVRSEMARK